MGCVFLIVTKHPSHRSMGRILGTPKDLMNQRDVCSIHLCIYIYIGDTCHLKHDQNISYHPTRVIEFSHS